MINLAKKKHNPDCMISWGSRRIYDTSRCEIIKPFWLCSNDIHIHYTYPKNIAFRLSSRIKIHVEKQKHLGERIRRMNKFFYGFFSIFLLFFYGIFLFHIAKKCWLLNITSCSTVCMRSQNIFANWLDIIGFLVNFLFLLDMNVRSHGRFLDF